MPLGIDQNVGTIVWSPLSGGQLTGKIRRGNPLPEGSRFNQLGSHGPAKDAEFLYGIVDVLDQVAAETGKSVAQVSLNWLLQRPTIDNIIIGARNEAQLKQNLEAVGWNLTVNQVKRLDAASDTTPIYPYWHQRNNSIFNTAPELY